MKRIYALLLTAALTAGLAVVPAEAADLTLSPGTVKLSELTGGQYRDDRYGLAFQDGLLLMKNKQGQYGYMDATGELVIDYQYSYASAFQNGMALVSKDQNTYFFINTAGETLHDVTLAPHEGGYAIPYPELGCAVICAPGNDLNGHRPMIGVCDFDGNLLVPMEYNQIAPFATTGNLINVYAHAEQDGKTGVINMLTGETLIPLIYDSDSQFHTQVYSGLVVVERHVEHQNDGSSYYALYDETGTLIYGALDKDPENRLQILGDNLISIDFDEKNESGGDTSDALIDRRGQPVANDGWRFGYQTFQNGLICASRMTDVKVQYAILDEGLHVVTDLRREAPFGDMRFYCNFNTLSEGYVTFRASFTDDASGLTYYNFGYSDTKGNIVWSDAGSTQGGDHSLVTVNPVASGYGAVTYPDGTLAVVELAGSASASLGNFVKINSYTPGQFGDVAEGQWYSDSIRTVYELGLMKGTSDHAFDLNGSITVGSALATAARLHKIYTTGNGDFNQGAVWYDVYVAYCKDNGIFTADFDDYSRPATRAEFAGILAGALPQEALSDITTIDDDILPDVKSDSPYGEEIYRLYRAGVLTGNDSSGTFTPNEPIGRSSAATIVGRMADPSLRSNALYLSAFEGDF